ncbi:type I-E CRISPR-associated protein Cse2/CasB [Streptomyces sp. NPDC088147]|uniref:type I-E CRISPR-associated protein Cse2/CasB n=1 Tax=Streptomyces sp. NPDC088147 TaxID=3365830 RepID=UPI00382F33BF
MTISVVNNSAPALRQRRGAFVTHLYRLQRDLSSPHRPVASDARRQLAVLRRAGSGPRYEAQGYEILFAFDPPREEERMWLTTATLFAQHPRPQFAEPWRRESIGTAMGLLAQQRQGSIARRFTQLVSVESAALPYYLRQALQLVGDGSVGVDFYRLLDELVVLLGSDRTSAGEDHRAQIRLDWARDYSRAQRGTRGRRTTLPPTASAPVPDAPTD